MLFDLYTNQIIDKNNTINKYEKDGKIIYYTGFIYYKGKRQGEETISFILDRYLERGRLDFNYFYGSYRIVLVDMINKSLCFWADNSGSTCFYYDERANLLADSFLEITSRKQDLKANLDSITEFLHFDCIYSDKTICEDILKTDSMKYYCYEKGKIICKDKDLGIWDKDKPYENMNQFMKDLKYALANLRLVDIITGGTDSRTVLAHLMDLNYDFDLAISGDKDMADVQIAKKIAKILNRNIIVSDESAEDLDHNKFKELFISSDGVSGALSRYRLTKNERVLKDKGYNIELGGVAGEYYKNGFLNQDFPFYLSGKINKERFYKLKLAPSNWDNKFFTDSIIKNKLGLKDRILETIFENETDKNDKKHKIYFRAGHKILRQRTVSLSNFNYFSIPSLSPFAEIDLLKLVYNKNPWSLELNKWQRREVSRYLPIAAGIQTDRGLTLSNSGMDILRDLAKNYMFLFKVGIKRSLLMKKQTHKNKRPDIFVRGRQMEDFYKAMDKCKDLGIISDNFNYEELPDLLADRLMTIGLVFMHFQD